MKQRHLFLLAGTVMFVSALGFSMSSDTQSDFLSPRFGVELEVRPAEAEQSFDVAIVIRNRTTGKTVARPSLSLVSSELASITATDPESGVEYLVHLEIGDQGRTANYSIELREPDGTASKFESRVPLDG